MGDPFNNSLHEHQVKPRAPQAPRSASPNRRERASDLRAAGASAAPTFKPIHTRRTFEEICERIREQLALGVLKPGDKLPAERELAQQLGVSRNVLREALRSLEMAGVLRLQKGVKGGAFIQAGRHPPHERASMRDMLSLGTISVRELSEARSMCSTSWCSWPARMRAGPTWMRWKPTSSGPSCDQEGRLLDRVECSREFYKLLAASTGNKVIADDQWTPVTEIHMRFVYANVVVQRGRDGPVSGEAAPVPGGAERAKRRGWRAGAAAVRIWNPCSGCWSRTPGRCRSVRRIGGGAARDAPIAARLKLRPCYKLLVEITTEVNVSNYAKYECLKVRCGRQGRDGDLNRPQARNAINQKLIRELRTIWDDLGRRSCRQRLRC